MHAQCPIAGDANALGIYTDEAAILHIFMLIMYVPLIPAPPRRSVALAGV